jgi:hypothetical protein
MTRIFNIKTRERGLPYSISDIILISLDFIERIRRHHGHLLMLKSWFPFLGRLRRPMGNVSEAACFGMSETRQCGSGV